MLTLWTDDPERARDADRAGIDRIGLDLERLGKRERQLDPRLWQTTHTEAALSLIGDSLSSARLFARTNPPHDGWAEEADRLIAGGAEILMLPCFRSAAQVREALELVADRARLVPLIETVDALGDVAAIAEIDGLREVHFGLNDLAIEMRLANRFTALVRPEVEDATRMLAGAGLRVGVGGIGRARDARLPIRSDLVYASYPRLRATGALIARSFFAGLDPGPEPLAHAVAAAREQLAHWYGARPDALDAARAELEATAA
ncbi:MAG TPA: aldolase/citrate lyase family protein [Solirubrobacteraceae bacterium]